MQSTPRHETPATPTMPGIGRATVMLAGPPLPLQFPSVGHFKARVESAIPHVQAVRNLTPATCAWVRKAYVSFGKALRETRSERRFLSGDVRQQVQVLEAWVAWMRARGMSPVAVNTYWRGLRLLLRWLQEADGTVNPMVFVASPRFGRVLPNFLTKDAATSVLACVRSHSWSSELARARNVAVIGLMLLAGLRRGEVVRLQLADVNLASGTVRIRGGKGRFGGKDRTGYLPPQLIDILRDYIAARTQAQRTHTELITCARRDAPATAEAVRRLCEVVSEVSHVHVRPHALRHTYATLLRASGVPDRIAIDLLGHTSYAMLQRYSHVFDGEHQEQAAKLRLDAA